MGTQRLEVPLDGHALALAAIELRAPSAQVETSGSVEVTDLQVRGETGWSELAWRPEGWRVRRPEADLDVPARVAEGVAFDVATPALASGGGRTYLYVAMPGRNPQSQTLPVLAEGGFAAEGTVDLAGASRALQPVGVLHDFPTMAEDEGIVVADLGAFSSAVYAASATVIDPDERWLATQPGSAPAVAAALRVSAPEAEVLDRAALAGRLRNDPLSVGIAGALTLGFMAGTVLAAIGFAVHAAVAIEARRTEFAVLQSLGLSRRQQALSLLLESGVLVAFSLLSGTLLGVGVARLVLPSVIVTSEGTPPVPSALVDVPVMAVAALNGVLLIVLLAVVALQVRAATRLPVPQALRSAQER